MPAPVRSKSDSSPGSQATAVAISTLNRSMEDSSGSVLLQLLLFVEVGEQGMYLGARLLRVVRAGDGHDGHGRSGGGQHVGQDCDCRIIWFWPHLA